MTTSTLDFIDGHLFLPGGCGLWNHSPAATLNCEIISRLCGIILQADQRRHAVRLLATRGCNLGWQRQVPEVAFWSGQPGGPDRFSASVVVGPDPWTIQRLALLPDFGQCRRASWAPEARTYVRNFCGPEELGNAKLWDNVFGLGSHSRHSGNKQGHEILSAGNHQWPKSRLPDQLWRWWQVEKGYVPKGSQSPHSWPNVRKQFESEHVAELEKVFSRIKGQQGRCASLSW